MRDRYEILFNCAEGIEHARKFHYELFRDEEAALVTDRYTIPTDGSNVLHFHHCIEMLYAETKQFTVVLDGTDYELSAGQFIIIPSFSIHDCTTPTNAVRWLIMIPPTLLGSTQKLLEGKTFDKCHQQDDGTMLRLLQLLRCANLKQGTFFSRADKESHDQLIRSLSAAVITTAIAACGLKEQSGSSVLLIELLKYLHLHFREPIRIPEVARTLLCTQKTLSDQFRRVFQMTIGSYVNHLRAVDVMINLRENPKLRLTEAAELSGFGSVRNLLRVYRSEFGCTPRESKADTELQQP